MKGWQFKCCSVLVCHSVLGLDTSPMYQCEWMLGGGFEGRWGVDWLPCMNVNVVRMNNKFNVKCALSASKKCCTNLFHCHCLDA